MVDFPTRRSLLATGAFTAGGVLSLDVALAQAPLNPTPACHDGDAATLRQTEGPFFKPSSPERAELIEPGMPGQPIDLVGLVLTRGCKPVADAIVPTELRYGRDEIHVPPTPVIAEESMGDPEAVPLGDTRA